MGRPRWMTLLAVLVMISFLGHFVADAVCVVLDGAAGEICADGNKSNGRSDTTSPVAADLHGSFDVPSSLSTVSPLALAFSQATATLTYHLYSPPPSSPPPKPLSSIF
ncbi:hypothetical protein MNBD_CHLOROFLEXI01-4850 [hydrothermal vent metagenome]|uniref:Uncharacterized protein n=1 Tax=hydrothermal vent metagenome TaxID=652676 RepID=A0A3B0VTJ0_9ZZZZ